MKSVTGYGLVSMATWAVWGCAGTSSPAAAPEGPTVSVNVAALNLQGVGDVVWDVEVVNGRTPTPNVVWQRRLSSSGYGDGAGSASYVGPCDADPTASVADNTVSLHLVGLYTAAVADPGAFGEAAPGGSFAFRDPGVLERSVHCVADQDVPVTFDVTVARAAEQGFFDFAVTFDNIFCSAKYDCDAADLLFDATGQRATTQILALSCTAGLDAAAETVLYLDPIVIYCGSGVTATIDPAAAHGNYRDLSAAPGGQWQGVMFTGGFDKLYQVATHTGDQSDVASGGASVSTRYWTVALGVTGDLTGCTLHTLGTVDDAARAGGADGGVVAGDSVYPYVDWTVDLGTCADASPLDGPGSDVVTRYFDTAAGHAFAAAYPLSYAPDCASDVLYLPSGVASPTNTDLCTQRDYSTCVLYSDSTQVSCGTCQYLTGCADATPGACADYDATTVCGAGMVCDGAGGCVSDCSNDDTYVHSGTASATTTDVCAWRDYSSCDAWTDTPQTTCGTCQSVTGCTDISAGSCANYPAGTVCGTAQVCDASGGCVHDCTSDDYYYISGSASATGTNYCRLRNYDALCSYVDSDQASCGTCQYVTGCSGSTAGSCANYAASTSCGGGQTCNGSGQCGDSFDVDNLDVGNVAFMMSVANDAEQWHAVLLSSQARNAVISGFPNLQTATFRNAVTATMDARPDLFLKQDLQSPSGTLGTTWSTPLTTTGPICTIPYFSKWYTWPDYWQLRVFHGDQPTVEVPTPAAPVNDDVPITDAVTLGGIVVMAHSHFPYIKYYQYTAR